MNTKAAIHCEVRKPLAIKINGITAKIAITSIIVSLLIPLLKSDLVAICSAIVKIDCE